MYSTARQINRLTRVQQRPFINTILAELASHYIVYGSTITTTVAGLLAYSVYNRYKISNPDEYLVRTGIMIPDIDITKHSFVFPLQKSEFISMRPSTYTFVLHCMSSEKIEFLLPCVFTIGPNNDKESLIKYVRLLNDNKQTINETIIGILEGETRVLASQMGVEELFNGRQQFIDTIVEKIQLILNPLGLIIINANIKEVKDAEHSNYFANMRKRKIAEAENQALVDISLAENAAKIKIALADKEGDIGKKNREAETRQQLALIEADTIVTENNQKQKMINSDAQVVVTKIQADKSITEANIEVDNRLKEKEFLMLAEVEKAKIGMVMEKARVADLTKAQVDAEALVKMSTGKASALQIEADAHLYYERKKAEAILYSKQQEALGEQNILEARAMGVNKLIESFKGDHTSFMQYSMLEDGLYEKLALRNSEAVKGMAPKINVWTTGADNSDANSYASSIANVMKMLPPMLSTIHEQTGIKVSDKIISMPKTKE